MTVRRAELKLVGQCNRCGLCCTARKDGRTLYCHNLQRMGALGVPGATFCKAYGIRHPGMRILMEDDLGVIRAEGACAHGSAVDAEQIVQYIGKGCSLQIAKEK